MVPTLSVYVLIIGYPVFVTPFTQDTSHDTRDEITGLEVTEWFKTKFNSPIKDLEKGINIGGPCRSISFLYRESSNGCQFPNKICLGTCHSYTLLLPSGKRLTHMTRCKPTFKNTTVPVLCPKGNIQWAVKSVTESCSCEGINFKYHG